MRVGGRGCGVCHGGWAEESDEVKQNRMEWEVECNIVTFTSQFSTCTMHEQSMNDISPSTLKCIYDSHDRLLRSGRGWESSHLC